jgi:hypothetical protein
MHGPRSDARDVQERWIDAREEYDSWERSQWMKEGQLVQEQKARDKIRMRGGGSEGTRDTGLQQDKVYQQKNRRTDDPRETEGAR